MIRELVLLSLLITVLAQWDLQREGDSKRSMKYCGEELNKLLSLICEDKFNSPYRKKSYDYPSYLEYGLLTNEEPGLQPEYTFPFHPKIKAISSLEYRRLKRGPVDECCKKSCSYSEIQGYCAKR